GAAKQFIKGLLGLPPWQPPNAVSLSQYLDEKIKGASSPNASNVADQTKEITYIANSPEEARDFLRMVINTADEVVRADKLVNESNPINYLADPIEKSHERA